MRAEGREYITLSAFAEKVQEVKRTSKKGGSTNERATDNFFDGKCPGDTRWAENPNEESGEAATGTPKQALGMAHWRMEQWM